MRKVVCVSLNVFKMFRILTVWCKSSRENYHSNLGYIQVRNIFFESNLVLSGLDRIRLSSD